MHKDLIASGKERMESQERIQERPSPVDAATGGELLVQRVRGGLWIFVTAVLLYGLADIATGRGPFGPLNRSRLALAAAILLGQGILRLRPTPSHATAVALAVMLIAAVTTAIGGRMTSDPATPTLVSVVLVTVSSSLLPWSPLAHSAVVIVTAFASLWSVFAVHGHFPLHYVYPGGAVLTVWIGSYYVLRELERNRQSLIHEALERRRAEERTRQHQAELAHVGRLSMMGQTAAELAHELNQPLGAIVSFAKGCTRRLQSGAPETPPEIFDALDQIATQAMRASEIIRRLRKFAKKGDSRRVVTSLNELVWEAAGMAETETRTQKIPIEYDLEGGLPVVEIDPIQIEQVVVNLVRNAFEAMQEDYLPKKRLVVSTERGDGVVLVAVRDTGCGIPADEQRIFDPFFTTRANGLGMGLSISRSIIEAHGGRLWSTANPEGGATFEFTLPVAAGQDVRIN